MKVYGTGKINNWHSY